MIFLIRHGEAAAAWGAAPDPGLSALGAKQARAAAESLDSQGANNAVTSPMRRCRETAQAFETLKRLDAPIVSAVSEVETPAEVDDRPAWLRGIMAGTWADAGDALTAWRHTATEAVSALPDGTAIFSHFVAINAIVSALTNRDEVLVFKPAHCSITLLERGGDGLRVAKLGDEAPPVVL